MKIIEENKKIRGTLYVENVSFDCGHSIPMYDVFDMFALNQIIGYLKFINNEYGRIFCRGECHLHNSLMPSIFREKPNTKALSKFLDLVKKVYDDPDLNKELNLSKWKDCDSKLIIESMLQHYGAKTRFIDVVDNHWIALWMGQNQFIALPNGYATYKPRDFGYYDNAQIMSSANLLFKSGKIKEGVDILQKVNPQELFQYILLVAIPYENRTSKGFYQSKNFDQIDLRQVLPSTFLRPHAQHGLLIKKKGLDHGNANFYDLSSQIVCVLRMRVDNVKLWLGDGNLVSQKNLFPSPAFDQGYNILLSRKDIFKHNDIIKYVD